MDELEQQLTAYLVSNEYTAFVGKFEDDLPSDIFLADLAKEYSNVGWIEFRHNGNIYQMYLAQVIE